MNYNENYNPENGNDAYEHIPAEEFVFVQMNERIHDKELETRPVGFLQDALIRFAHNRGAVVCSGILLVLILFAIITPFVSSYEVSEKDGYYAYVLPRLSSSFDLGFWNGCSKKQINQQTYDYYSAIPDAIAKDYGTEEIIVANRPQTVHNISLDSYAKVGYVNILLTDDEYEEVLAYQEETGIQLLYPMVDESKIECQTYKSDPNAWFLTNPKGVAERDKNGELQNIYLKDENSPDGYAYSVSKAHGTQYQIRTLYSSWYEYKNGKQACFLFGADEYGYDICVRMAAGARLSLTVSVLAAIVNLIIGIIIGALEGYYGGTFDLLMERIKDILYEIPSIVFMTLFQIYFAKKLGSLFAMFICFIFFGWIGTSSTVRAQFYRFKGQEYVMAARTLGAKDSRLIFRHILPNASGFIITACVLTIPYTIFSEATYSYLGIVNLNSKTLTSLGSMLENGQQTLSTYPHCVFFPAIFLSLLLICFNIFGNGLRDAFNPSLRGADE
ncbi:MAG: ABC transporter permease [Lachnospiraceae bacterium]|nr:ABC transporter permease [Lachnospiraceae bacterium]MDY4971371.1 ABC transporter permease [Lachnospiraceae bacterium]